MCNPVLATFAIQATQTLVGANAQQKAANKQADMLNQQENANQNAYSLRMNQEAQQAASQANQRNLAAQQELATHTAAAGEYGGGVSVDREAASISASRNNDLSTIETNKNNQLSQLGQEARASGARYNAQLASLSRPSKLGIALSLAGQATSAWASTVKPNPKP